MAGEFDFSKSRYELGLRLAYGKNTHGADVRLYTLFPRWGIFILKPGRPALAGLGLSFIVEGVISAAQAESPGWEFGLTPMLQLNLPLGKSLLLFLEGGAGIIWENIDTPAIVHTFNFTPQVGGGLNFGLRALGVTF